MTGFLFTDYVSHQFGIIPIERPKALTIETFSLTLETIQNILIKYLGDHKPIDPFKARLVTKTCS